MDEMTPAVAHVISRISSLRGIESTDLGKDGAINVVIAGGINRDLREEVLDIGRRAMLAVRVYYRMPDGNVIGESKPVIETLYGKSEWVEDYYKTVRVPGFAGDSSDAPPEEVAAEPKGSLKLRRIRAQTRGRPVVAWRVGDDEIRVGTKIKFEKEACLQWTSGRTLTIKPGAEAHIAELSTRRPIVFIRIGDYDSVELPVHTIGHLFTTVKANGKVKSEAKEPKKKDLPPEIHRILNAVGFGQPVGWARDNDTDNVPANDPFFRDRWISRGVTTIDDDIETEDDQVLPDPDDDTEDPSHKHRALIVGKR